MSLRRVLAGVCALATMALAPTAASRRARGAIHPGVQTFTDGAQCTANFIFSDGADDVRRPGGPLLRHRRSTDTDGCDSRFAADRHAGPGRRRQQAGHAWSTTRGSRMQANGESDADTCAVQRPRADQARPGRRGERSTHRCPASAGRRASASLPRARRDRLHVRQLRAARRRHEAQPEAGHRRPAAAERLVDRRLHRHPGHPGRLGQRVHDRDRPGGRHPEHRGDRAAAGSNGVGDLPRELAYMHGHGGPDATVVNGTKPFNPSLVERHPRRIRRSTHGGGPLGSAAVSHPHRHPARRRDRPRDPRAHPRGPRRRRRLRLRGAPRSAAPSIDANGTALTDEVLAACRARRRRAARRGRRPEVGHDRPRRAAARAGPARPAQGPGPVREPAPGPAAAGALRRQPAARAT